MQLVSLLLIYEVISIYECKNYESKEESDHENDVDPIDQEKVGNT